MKFAFLMLINAKIAVINSFHSLSVMAFICWEISCFNIQKKCNSYNNKIKSMETKAAANLLFFNIFCFLSARQSMWKCSERQTSEHKFVMWILQQQQFASRNATYFNVLYAPIVTTFPQSSWSRFLFLFFIFK